MRLVFLDPGPLGLLSNPRGGPRAVQCRKWARDLLAAGVRVFVPEIADYEVRRELLRAGKTAGLRRLDQVKAGLDYAPITTDVMLKAAELWAHARQAGRPTAAPDALDGDCILAAHALLAASPGDSLTVATDNVGHLARFVNALPWDQITP
jgi:predicted nucleic acid-binding protein